MPVQARNVLLEGFVLPLQSLGLLPMPQELRLLAPPVTLLCSQPVTPPDFPVCLQAVTDRWRPAVHSSRQARVTRCKAHAGTRRQARQCMLGDAVLRKRRAHP